MSRGVALVGLGRWANAHVAAAGRTDAVEVVSCFDRTEEGRRQFAAGHGILRAAESYEEILADPDVVGIVLSTPNDRHVEMAEHAAAAGKAVLIDKPVAVDVTEGLRLWRIQRSGAPPIGVAHHSRRLAGHRAAKRWIDSGQAGTVRLAHGDFSNNRGAFMHADAWHRHARGSEAGVLIQVGIHQVENLLYLLGPAVSVNARFMYDALGPEMPDAAAVVMTHASGALSTVTSSWTTPSHYRLVLQATGGNLAYRLDHGHWTSGDVDDHGELELDPVAGDRGPFPAPKGDPLAEQIGELGDAAAGVGRMEVDVAAGLRCVAVVQAAVRSAAAAGTEVQLNGLLQEAGASDEEIGILLHG